MKCPNLIIIINYYYDMQSYKFQNYYSLSIFRTLYTLRYILIWSRLNFSHISYKRHVLKSDAY